METKKRKLTQSELDVLFPSRKVDLGGGIEVTVTPIPLPVLPKVLDAFTNLMLRVQAGISPATLAVESIKDIMELLPHCIDVEIEDLPAIVSPDLIGALLDLNFSEDFVGKWTALAKTLGQAAAIGQGMQGKDEK